MSDCDQVKRRAYTDNKELSEFKQIGRDLQRVWDHDCFEIIISLSAK